MTGNGWFQILLFLGVVLLVTKPMGVYLYRVFERKSTWLDPVLRPIERLIYRVSGIDEKKEMKWTEYGVTMLVFSGASMLLLYLIERVQLWLPWNPQKLPNVGTDLAWNTAASFTTNTNWQSYMPESTMSYLTQMAGLAYHNFASAAVGIALAIACDSRRGAQGILHHREFLGRCHAGISVGATSLQPGRRALPGVPGSGAKPASLHQR